MVEAAREPQGDAGSGSFASDALHFADPDWVRGLFNLVAATRLDGSATFAAVIRGSIGNWQGSSITPRRSHLARQSEPIEGEELMSSSGSSTCYWSEPACGMYHVLEMPCPLEAGQKSHACKSQDGESQSKGKGIGRDGCSPLNSGKFAGSVTEELKTRAMAHQKKEQIYQEHVAPLQQLTMVSQTEGRTLPSELEMAAKKRKIQEIMTSGFGAMAMGAHYAENEAFHNAEKRLAGLEMESLAGCKRSWQRITT